MKILISGSNGLVGKELTKFLKNKDYDVVPLLRKDVDNFPYWNLDKKVVDFKNQKFDVIIHLAGENIASGRWTKKKKEKILNSRVEGTKLLCEQILAQNLKPKLLISASAIGYYGDTKEVEVDENSNKGNGFLSDVCEKWEEATNILKNESRVVNLRIGGVISSKGGMLKEMLLPFKLGLGGYVGNGKQFISWVSIHDLVGIVDFIINNDNISGPVNCVSNNPVTNKEFSKTLGKVLKRPVLFSIPKFVLKTLIGEMSKELLFNSNNVIPRKLMNSGYVFKFSKIEHALKKELKK